VTHQLARTLAFWFVFGAGVALAATPSGIPDTLITAPQGLTAVARMFVREGTTPTAFNEYVQHATSIGSALLQAWLPKGYRAYRVHDPDRTFDYEVVVSPSDNSFVIYGASGYIGGWEPVKQRLPRIEELLAPVLQGYRKRELRNGVVYAATGKPIVELLVSRGMPSETHNANYSVWMLIFPPGVTILTVDAPCEWWTATPPPGWHATSARACAPRWIEVPHT
jgi:hypothetical protein